MTKSFSLHESIQYVFSNFQLEEKLCHIVGMEMVLPSHEPLIFKVINLGSDTFGNPIFQKGLQN